MSYLYDKLRDALGGKNFKSGVSMKGWSPNEVRGIVIMRDWYCYNEGLYSDC